MSKSVLDKLGPDVLSDIRGIVFLAEELLSVVPGKRYQSIETERLIYRGSTKLKDKNVLVIPYSEFLDRIETLLT
jgi:hypothetical protein